MKTFFFPGLGPGTGGVLKERALDAERAAFDRDALVARTRRRRGASGGKHRRLAVRLRESGHRRSARTMARRVVADRAAGARGPHFRRGRPLPRRAGLLGRRIGGRAASLRAHALGFVEQPRFDALLWACDVNFVRGEDSFVRAQWAAKTVRLAHLSASRRRASAQARRRPRALRERPCPTQRATPSRASGTPGTAPDTPDWADFWRHRAAAEPARRRLGDGARLRRRPGRKSGACAEIAKTQLK